MGSVFPKARPVSRRQQQYFASKANSTGDRKKLVKREQNLQIECASWLRSVLPPGVHFRSDTGSGAFNSEYEKTIHNAMQSSDKQPDIFIYAMRRGYGGLAIELKDEGVNLRMTRDGTKIRVNRKRVPPTKKYPTGWKILERDYKIRKKGDWSSLHVEKQAQVLEDYKRQGYIGFFAVGAEQFRKLVCWYFEGEIEYIPVTNGTIF